MHETFYFRDGNFLVIRDGAELPHVCLRTNRNLSQDDWRKKVPVLWTPPWVYMLLIAGGPVLCVIVSMIVRKKAKFTYSLDKDTRGKIFRWRMLALATLLVGIALFFMAPGQSSDDAMVGYIFGGIALLFAALIIYNLSNPIKVGGYVNDWFKIKGCSPDFLNTLPDANRMH